MCGTSCVFDHTLVHMLSLRTHVCVLLSHWGNFTVAENTYISYVLQGKHLSAQPDTCPAVSNEPHMCIVGENVHFTLVSLCVELTVLHLFPLRSACLQYGDTSVAPGSADVGVNAARLFTLNHAGTHQTPRCCSYGLVSSSY